MDKHGKINLEYYKVFYYVCRCGGITAAAEVLCISQPAVSQAVHQLETALGCRLFLRTSKGVYHKNTASRKVSRLSKAVNAMA